jgi:exosome complex RNA-binding protein Csl4
VTSALERQSHESRESTTPDGSASPRYQVLVVPTTATSASDVDILSSSSSSPRSILASSFVIREGNIVLGIVTRLSVTQVFVEIVALAEVGILPYRHEGIIKLDDIRSRMTNVSGTVNQGNNSVQIDVESIAMPLRVAEDAYRPGDMILARVLGGSGGVGSSDLRRYPLSTSEVSLGVVLARSSVSGIPMIPSSWKEMTCPQTGCVESRKVAKPPML